MKIPKRQSIIVVCSSLILSVLTITTFPPYDINSIGMFCISILLILMTRNVKKYAIFVVIATSCFLLIPGVGNPFPIYGSMIAIGLWKLYDKRKRVLLATIAEISINTFSWIRDNLNNIQGIVSAIILFNIMIISAYYIGQSLQWRDEAKKSQQLQHEMEINKIKQQRIEHDKQVINHIHDTTTMHLTYIILRSQKEIDNTSNQQQKQYYNDIKDHANASLKSIHDVIAMLNYKDTDILNEDITTNSHKISELISQSDAMLHQAGFNGTTIYPKSIPAYIQNNIQISSLLREIYTNILRHGNTINKDYSVIISFKNHVLSIVSINTISGDSVGGISGVGLKHCKEIVSTLHGNFSTNVENKDWITQIRIPIYPK